LDNTDYLQKLAAEAMRANATRQFTVKCLACGKRQARSLHWLQTQEFKCPTCGGNLDKAPLHRITKEILQAMRGKSKAPKQRADRAGKLAPIKRHDDAKKYQLVLQFRGDAPADLDEAAALEEELIAALGDSADVDGHDIGSGETNIFIFTTDPTGTFRRAMPVLTRRKCLPAVTAAYRPVDGEQFVVLWPEGSRLKFVVT
jgi:hypothetical protein